MKSIIVVGGLIGMLVVQYPGSAGPVNINRANVDELVTELNGVGVKKAKEIILYREKHGEFKAVEELQEVKGIGKKLYEQNLANIKIIDNE